MATETVQIMEGIYDENDRVAARVQEKLAGKGVYAINVMGSPGAGKTSCLTALIGAKGIHTIRDRGDIESDIDTRALRNWASSGADQHCRAATRTDPSSKTPSAHALAHKGPLSSRTSAPVCP
jgi:hypothetical protein